MSEEVVVDWMNVGDGGLTTSVACLPQGKLDMFYRTNTAGAEVFHCLMTLCLAWRKIILKYMQ